MTSNNNAQEWSLCVAGAGIGALEWFAFATADKTLGVTTPFENTAACIGEAITSGSPQLTAYYEARRATPTRLGVDARGWDPARGLPSGARCKWVDVDRSARVMAPTFRR